MITKDNINELTGEQKAWLGGYFQAKASFGTNKQNAPVLECSSTEKEEMERLKEMTGCGNLYTEKRDERKTLYRWKVNAIYNLKGLFKLTQKYFLGETRKRSEKMLQFCDRKVNNSASNRLSTQQIAEIFLKRGTYKEIANEYGTSKSTVSRIKNQKWHKEITNELIKRVRNRDDVELDPRTINHARNQPQG